MIGYTIAIYCFLDDYLQAIYPIENNQMQKLLQQCYWQHSTLEVTIQKQVFI
jgi:hypothetical protein